MVAGVERAIGSRHSAEHPADARSALRRAVIGGILVAINTRLKSEEIAYILNHSGAKVLIVDTEFAPLVKPCSIHVRP